MSQNIIIKGKDNPVVITFGFTGDFADNGITLFDRIVVNIGNETYDTDINTDELFTVGQSELRLRIGDITSLEPNYYPLEIIGYTATYNDGYVLSSQAVNKLPNVQVI